MPILGANTTLQWRTAWAALRLFSFYRLIISGFFVALLWAGKLSTHIGGHAPMLFIIGTTGYLMAAIFAQMFLEYRVFRFTMHVYIQVFIDIAAITLMMYASGGINSGLGMLLVISVAGGSILTAGRTATIFATLATVAVLIEETLLWVFAASVAVHTTQTGLLVAAFFATAFLGHALAIRISESEALAAQRGVDLANMSRLNEHIIQRMQSGILVLDEDRHIRLVNESAKQLLGVSGQWESSPLSVLDVELDQRLNTWVQDPTQPTMLFRPDTWETHLQVSFAHLGSGENSGTMVFLEDAAVIQQRVQHLKLASLGRLTASIAHEIRNPLGAIGHAVQLLKESSELSESDLRLTNIIHDHSQRLNRVIQNVLELGRRDGATPDNFAIGPWLRSFVEDFCRRKHLADGLVTLTVETEAIMVRMDRSQLDQIVWNLCENGLRYSRGNPLLEIYCGINALSQRPYLDVIDHGTGIRPGMEDQIFEPFFTDNSTGTGLGLYLAGELCEFNQASLSLHRNSAEGCCFRISFAHPDKQQLVTDL